MSGFIQRGVEQILQKQPHDVVILSALRTPVTKSYKGGLKDAYDHELLYHVIPHPLFLWFTFCVKSTFIHNDVPRRPGRFPII
jgi:hypothetical protein